MKSTYSHTKPEQNRTPIVGLKKFRFDDRRCGSFVCVRIEGDVTTTGAGTRQGRSRRGHARQTACHAQTDRGKLDHAVQVRRREGGHGRRRQQTLRLGDEGRRGARPRRERSDQDGGHGHARDRERHTPGTLVPRIPGRRSGGARAEAQGRAQRLEIQTEARTDARAGARRTGAATDRCACAWSTSSGNECRPRACPWSCGAWD